MFRSFYEPTKNVWVSRHTKITFQIPNPLNTICIQISMQRVAPPINFQGTSLCGLIDYPIRSLWHKTFQKKNVTEIIRLKKFKTYQIPSSQNTKDTTGFDTRN